MYPPAELQRSIIPAQVPQMGFPSFTQSLSALKMPHCSPISAIAVLSPVEEREVVKQQEIVHEYANDVVHFQTTPPGRIIPSTPSRSSTSLI